MLIKNINNELFDHYVASHQEHLNLLSNHRQEVRGYLLNKANNFIDLHVEKLKDIQSKVDSGNHLSELHIAHLQSVIDGYLHHKQMINHCHKGKSMFADNMKRVAAGVAAIIGVSSMAHGAGNDTYLLPPEEGNPASQVSVEPTTVKSISSASAFIRGSAGDLSKLSEVLDKIRIYANNSTIQRACGQLISSLIGGSSLTRGTFNSWDIDSFLNQLQPRRSTSLEQIEKNVFALRVIQHVQKLLTQDSTQEDESDERLRLYMINTYLNNLSMLLNGGQKHIDKIGGQVYESLKGEMLTQQAPRLLHEAMGKAFASMNQRDDELVKHAYQMVKSLLEKQNNSEIKNRLLKGLSDVTNKLSYDSSVRDDINAFIESEFKLLEPDEATGNISDVLSSIERRLNVLSKEASNPIRNAELRQAAKRLRKLYQMNASSEDVTLKMDIVRMHLNALIALPSHDSTTMPLINWTLKHLYNALKRNREFILRWQSLLYYGEAIKLKPRASVGPHTMAWATERLNQEMGRL